jgi:hypothetical protein
MDDQLNISIQDVLAAIGFKAVSIATVIQQHAVGSPFPNPEQLVLVIRDMLSKAEIIQKFGGVLGGDPHMTSTGKIGAELS